MPDLFVTPTLAIPAVEVGIAFSRSSGPGGQNVNKVESKVELRWAPATSSALAALAEPDRAWLLARLHGKLTIHGELIVTSTVTRDQIRNRTDAERKLVEIVRTALDRPKPRRPTKPSKGAKERRITAKKVRGQRVRDRSVDH